IGGVVVARSVTQKRTTPRPMILGGASYLLGSGGQGRGRTADLPLFRRTLVPTELPDLGRLRLPGAVLTGFEPATSTLTGWRALLAALQDLVSRKFATTALFGSFSVPVLWCASRRAP